MSESQKQRNLVSRINAAAALISANAHSGSGNTLLSSQWVIDNILGGKQINRMVKIEKILRLAQ